jgi:hypothetical protein
VEQAMSRAEAKALGLMRYVPHRPCLRGHFERYIGSACVECCRLRSQTPEHKAKERVRRSAPGYLMKGRLKGRLKRWLSKPKRPDRTNRGKTLEEIAKKINENRQRSIERRREQWRKRRQLEQLALKAIKQLGINLEEFHVEHRNR